MIPKSTLSTLFLLVSNILISSHGFTTPQNRIISHSLLCAKSRNHVSTTRLQASGTASAATGLLVASIAGRISERTILPANSGILGTLITAGILSNFGWIPSAHALYDLCWSLFLPGSLALTLLAEMPGAQEESSSNDVSKVGLAFFISSLASIVGCSFSFFICRAFPKLWLSPLDAAVAGGCLAASYVGGSINFFATARLVNGKPSLLSAMAAADLIVLAIYFAWLTTALQNKRLLRCFKEEPTGAGSIDDDDQLTTQTIPFPSTLRLFASILASLLAWAMAAVANIVEGWISPFLAGTACGVIAIMGIALQRFVPPSRLWNAMRQAASPLASFAFQIFFASIGTSANLGQALQSGPASVWFSLTAIFVHIIGAIGGALVINVFCPTQLQLKHVLVASNAAIGGPATAAAYAGQQRTELTLAATVWGVVGYGVGTNLGLGMCRWYQSWL